MKARTLFAIIFCNTLMFTIAVSHNCLAADGPPPAQVRVAPVVQEEVSQTRSVIGLLYYDRVSEISTELAGLVDHVEVNQGDRVTKEDVLVRLNTEILEKEIAYQKSRIEQIELRIDNARKNFERLERLFDKSGISEKEYDDALFAYQDAEKEKQAIKSTLEKLLIQKKTLYHHRPIRRYYSYQRR